MGVRRMDETRRDETLRSAQCAPARCGLRPAVWGWPACAGIGHERTGMWYRHVLGFVLGTHHTHWLH